MATNAFVFDFDGVIVDSERHWKTLGDGVFFPSLVPGWTRKDGVRFMGYGVRDAYDVLCKDYGVTLSFAAYEERLNACVSQVYAALCVPLPGLEGLLTRLNAMDVAIGIASSSQPSWIATALRRLQLETWFPVIVTAADVGHRAKPAPDVYRRAAELLGVPARRCIAFEDSKNGILSAKAAGMTCIAIHTDMNIEQHLFEADKHVTHMDELTTDVLTTLFSSVAD